MRAPRAALYSQGIVTRTHKFARYFAATEHQTPTTWAELFECNDVVLYDIGRDPHELVNLAHPRYRHQYRALILELNALLNEVVERETAPGAPPARGASRRTAVKLPWLPISARDEDKQQARGRRASLGS